MFQELNFVGIVVKDVAKATEFYGQQLGFTIDEAESLPNRYTQFKLGGSTVLALLGDFEEEGIEQRFDTAFFVNDVDAAYAQLQSKGVELINAPRDMPFGRTFLFRTPDGHVWRVMTQGQTS